MQYIKKISLIAIIIMLTCCTSKADDNPHQVIVEKRGSITNITKKGNLMITHQLNCISLDQAKNTYTPADLYASTAECIKSNRSKDAAELFLLAGSYSCYDAKRITDRSAHGAKSILIMNNIASLPDNDAKKNWKSDAKKIMRDNASICSKIKEIGLPNYVPIYMATHGMQSYQTHYSNLIDETIDKNLNWNQCLTKYLKCVQSDN